MAFDIEIVQGDITKVNAEAIVNAANNRFWMGSGVAGAIKTAGGSNIEKEAMNKGPVMTGEAVYSTAGTLPYKVVIHAAVMGQGLKTSAEYIRKATVSSLNIAEDLKLKSVAFPAFGTGVGGFPMAACAFNMVNAVWGYNPNSKVIEKVVFCLYDSFGYSIFKEELKKKKYRA
jgi:O-acetyl-ADP-ribose deacetylase (regulator of RNase III)